MSLAPIALFVYKRYSHTQQAVQSLLANKSAGDSNLYIFSDGPKNEKENYDVQKVREYIHSIKGFSKVVIRENEKNIGLAASIINGVSKILKENTKVVVLEDDLVLSQFFLEYMNKALDLYEHDESVISIHGYIYPVKAELPETFFLKGADCWGWATWKRGWDIFESDAVKLMNKIYSDKRENEFDLNGAVKNMKMLKMQIRGEINSWAIRWHASAFLMHKYTLYPGRSLVKNIGMGKMSTHTKKTNVYDVELSSKPIKVEKIEVRENEFAKREIEKYFRSIRKNYLQKILNTLRNGFKVR
jgi:GR25 family glycosyltransferase involved in LPS biosynthesis